MTKHANRTYTPLPKHMLFYLSLMAALLTPSLCSADITILNVNRQAGVGVYAAGGSDPPANTGDWAESSNLGDFSKSFAAAQSGPSAFSSASASQNTRILTTDGQLLISGSGSSSGTASDPVGGEVNAFGYNGIDVEFELTGQHLFSLEIQTAFENGSSVSYMLFHGLDGGATVSHDYGFPWSASSGGVVSGILPAGRYEFFLRSYIYSPGTWFPTPLHTQNASFAVNLSIVPEIGPIDSDGDGILDDADLFPSDPGESSDTDGDNLGNNADTDDDGDGMLDVGDAFPLDPMESVDTDGDGIGNHADTDDDNDGVPDADDVNSLDPDSDDDGLNDGAEITIGTDPLNPDTDNDSLLDGTEVETGTNPLLADSDSDGLMDGQEVALHTNPLDADTDDDGLLDGVDPTPTTPGAPADFLEHHLQALASNIQAQRISAFDGANNNARAGRKNALQNQVLACANMVKSGNYAGALDKLQAELRSKVDGISTPPDFMAAGAAKDHVRAEIDLIASLLAYLQ